MNMQQICKKYTNYRQSLNKDLALNGKKEEETASNALVTDYNYLIIQLKK